jgi:hypothetical protein
MVGYSSLIGDPDKAVGRFKPHRNHKAGNGKSAELFEITTRRFFRYLPEIGYLRVAENLYPVRMQMFRIPCEREPRFLYARSFNLVAKTSLPGKKGKIKSILGIMKEIFNGGTALSQSLLSCS